MQHIHDYSYIGFERPALLGRLSGGLGHEEIAGTAAIFLLPDALYLEVQFRGLPASEIFGFHIHDGVVCTTESSFEDAGGHLDLCGEGVWCGRHPYHAGVLPPIFSDENGDAVMGVYLDKARVEYVSGKTIILHSGRDDFSSLPVGSSGIRIACGILAENL